MSDDLKELKPCPFCGKAPKLEQSPNFGPGVWLKDSPRPAEYMVCMIHCCHISIYKSEPVDHYEGDEKKCADKSFFFASLEWNRRAPSPELEQAKSDAARYQFLRKFPSLPDDELQRVTDAMDLFHGATGTPTPEDFDAAVDAGIATIQSQEVFSKEKVKS